MVDASRLAAGIRSYGEMSENGRRSRRRKNEFGGLSVGMEIELIVLLALAVIGQAVFAVFEVETPAWRKILKWTLVIAITIGLSRLVGHWALILPIAGGVAGVAGHTIWCRRHGIDPLHGTPRRRYYELRGWAWRD